MNYNQQFTINLKQDMGWHMHKLHFHEYIEITLILSDGGQVFLDKDMYPLNSNTLIVLKPNTLHRTTLLDSSQLFQRYVLRIMPGMVEHLSTPHTNFSSILKNSSPCVQLSEAQARELAALFESLRTPVKDDEFGADVEQSITLLRILLRVCGAIRGSDPRAALPDAAASADAFNPDYERIQPILAYIRSHYTQPITLDFLAEHFHISKHYLCHTFKKGIGFSVMEYIIQARIIESQRLLREGASVQEACEASGFRSYAHYIRTFTNYVGISPKQYAMEFEQGIPLRADDEEV